jgi:hypothetical protein
VFLLNSTLFPILPLCSLDSTISHIITSTSSDDDKIHIAEEINTPSNLYNLIKILPFARKLDLLNKSMQEYPLGK